MIKKIKTIFDVKRIKNKKIKSKIQFVSKKNKKLKSKTKSQSNNILNNNILKRFLTRGKK